jgi:hypothetical protein
MFTRPTMDSAQFKNLTDALHRIVVSDAIVMSIRLAALQGIEDLEMGSGADKMVERDVIQYTADWGWASDRSRSHASDFYNA